MILFIHGESEFHVINSIIGWNIIKQLDFNLTWLTIWQIDDTLESQQTTVNLFSYVAFVQKVSAPIPITL